ncbi:MAG: hypothetical protein FJY81_05130, partial [Candidatus Aminicenantes bacterium]|nr:hypothetical protein [Candidatus Aminicenantes bacterium]
MKKIRRPRSREKLLRGGLVGAGAFALALLLHLLGVFQPLEWKSWDFRLRLGADPGRADRDIVLLLIDQY